MDQSESGDNVACYRILNYEEVANNIIEDKIHDANESKVNEDIGDEESAECSHNVYKSSWKEMNIALPIQCKIIIIIV